MPNLIDGLITSISISDFNLISNKTYGYSSSTELPVAADGNMGVRYYFLNTQSSITIDVNHDIFKIDIFLICNDSSDSHGFYTFKFASAKVSTNLLNFGNKTTCSWAFIKPIFGVTLGMLTNNDGNAGRIYRNTGKDDNSMDIIQFHSAGRIQNFTVEYSGEGVGSAQNIFVARIFYEK